MKEVKGAGGTSGGIAQFLISVLMMIGGGYLLLNAIHVNGHFGMTYGLYRFGGGYAITTGMIFIPFMFGVGMIFYNAKQFLGWILSIGSLAAMIFGVISSLQLSMRHMTAFDLIVILVLLVGGIGLFLRSLRDADKSLQKYNDKNGFK